MTEQIVEIDQLTLTFAISENKREVELPKSQTRIEQSNQLRILTEATKKVFLPLEINEKGDAFTFSFHIDANMKDWQEIKQLHRHDQLRLLSNLTQLRDILTSRATFFVHPENIVFDENLMPRIVFRGVRELIPPFKMDEQMLLKQLKCYSIALLSSKLTFDQLYNGGLEQANDTEFEQKIQQFDDLTELENYLYFLFVAEQKKTDQTMKLTSIRHFNLFKGLSFGFATLIFLLAIPFLYTRLVSLPYQESLIQAYEAYMISDFDGVIESLTDHDVEDMTAVSMYALAYAYVRNDDLSEDSKAMITNNLSANTDPDYLMYWIYTGREQLELAMDKATYLDDPQLIIYGLIKQIEQTRKDPNLSGNERNDQINQLENQLNRYLEEYDLSNEALLESGDSDLTAEEES